MLNLVGVRPELVAIATLAGSRGRVSFIVTEGVRTAERQRQLVVTGKSQTQRSRHLTGHAIDVVALHEGAVTWQWPFYEQIAAAFKGAAHELGVPVEWGGDWTSLKDGPHFQLPWASYPA